MNKLANTITPADQMEHEVDQARAQVSATIDAIQSKLTPGQMMDQAIGYMRKSLPAEFTTNLGSTVRDNPMPVALVGIGLAWLMASGRSGGDRWRGDGHVPYDEWDTDVDRDRSLGSSYTVGSSVAKPANGNAGDGIASKVSDMTQRIRDKASQTSSLARGATQRTRERLSHGVHSAGERVGELSERSRAQAERARDTVSHIVEEQPLVLGALGLAVGALLGAVLPPTRPEDELMGGAKDDLLRSAKSAAREQAESVRESAERVAQTAKEEFQRKAGEMSGDVPDAAARADRNPDSGSAQNVSNTEV
jgi:ElaB/YqjD/DUF883 family membrane-anchored ribosome-binding protein